MLDHSAYALANLAGCASPDAPTSPGARFLLDVQDAVNEANEFAPYADRREDFTDAAHALADSAVPVYTHARWQAFLDLAAYNEDMSEYLASSDDLTKAAGVALYIIAERLSQLLMSELADEADGV